MSKPMTEEQVNKLVEREVAKAVKAERKRCVEIMKTLAGELKGAIAAVRAPSPLGD
jgi:hypothetical protein